MAINDFIYSDNNTVITGIKTEGLKNIHIPSGVKKIAQFAFSDTNIESVFFPSSLEEIDELAFEYCTYLKKVIFAVNCKLNKIGDEAFACCQNLKEIRLPDSVKHIGYNAFVNCEMLQEVFIPISVHTIDSCAFENCHQDLIIKLERNKVPSSFHPNWNIDDCKVELTLKNFTIKPLSKPNVNKESNSVSNTNQQIINYPKKDELEPFIVSDYFLGGKQIVVVMEKINQ